MVACATTPCPDSMQRRNFRALPHSALLRQRGTAVYGRSAPLRPRLPSPPTHTHTHTTTTHARTHKHNLDHQRHLHQLCLSPAYPGALSAPQIDGNELKSAIRNSGAISSMYQESLTTFGYLVAATVAFDLGVFAFKGPEAAFDFLTAYFVEDSLSVDNLFVFLLLFRYFRVPPQLVDICLDYGITGSIILRGVFIFAGQD